MKRVGGIWEKFISVSNAELAIYNGTQNKRSDYVVHRKLGYDDHIPEHYGKLDPAKVTAYAEKRIRELQNGWEPSPMRHMVIHSPSGGKTRNIDCPRLADHIIHWMLMQSIHDVIMRGMYEHSYGSIPNRGIDAARKNVEKWIRSDTKAKYFVKLDIRKFYEHVDHNLLKEAFRRSIKDVRILEIIFSIIDCVESGLPIGTYTSQWFANFFLQPLDHHIKQDMCKYRRGKRTNFVTHYLRYMDDMLLIGSSKRDIEKAVREIIRYASEDLRLEVKSCWEIKQIAADSSDIGDNVAPVDIVGYRFYRDHTEIRGQIFLHTSRLAEKIRKNLERNGKVMLHDAQGIVSLCGWFSHADSKNFLRNYIHNKVDLNFMERVISYASTHGIVGTTACVYCRKRTEAGCYQILYGYSGGTTRRRFCVHGDNVDHGSSVPEQS